jgi:TP901 family phage tail tape measure protein
MALLTSVLSVKLLDGVTGPAKGISKALSGIKAASLGLNNTPVTALAKMDRAIAANNASLLNMRMGLVDAAAGFVALKGVIGEPVRAAREFQSAMADVKKVVNFGSPEEADALAKGLLDLSTKIPVAAKELAGIAAAAGQAGLAVEDLLPFAENVAYVATAFSIPTEEAAEALAKLKTALGLTVPEVMLLADHMHVLANNMATSESDVLDIVRRVGALGEVNSIAAKEIGALGAAMSASGVESDVAATGIRNMILALVQGTNATKSQKAALAALGMDTVQVAKRVQTEGIGVIVEILEAIQMQAPDTRAALLSMMFGQRAVDALGPLLGNLGTLYQALGLVADDAKNAGAALQEFEKKAKASAAAQKVFENRVKLLGITLGNALLPDIDRGIGLLGRFAVKLSEGIDLMPGLTRVVVWATAAVVGLRVATIGLRYGFLLAKGGALQLARGLIVFRGVALATAASLGTLKAAFAAGFGKLVLLNAVAPAVGALKTLGAVAAGIGGALTAITLPIWLTIAAVTALGLAIYKYWKPISGFAIGFFRGLGDALEPIAPLLLPIKAAFSVVGSVVGWVSGLIGDLIGWVGNLLKPVDDVNGAWESFGENLGTKFGAGIMRAIGLLKRLLSPLTLVVDAIRFLGSGFGGFGDVPGAPGAPPPTPRAGGGPVSAGKSYLVGERRPEIFTPSRAGTILPDAASASGGNRGGTSITANFSFSGMGDADPAEIERRVRRALRDELGDMMRSSYLDLRTV